MDYLDFEIEIDLGNGREYPISVIRSAGGEARETMHFPFSELELENQLLTLQNVLLRSGGKRRKIPSKEEQVVQSFGQALFNALFSGEVRSRYAVSLREAAHQNKGLRLKLRILSPELAVLPWEFIYDGGASEYVCLSNITPIVRYLDLPQPPQPLTVTLPLNILGIATSPKDKNLDDLDIQREKQRIEKALERLQANDIVKLNWLQRQSWQDLQREMRTGTLHILHFIGHGGFDPNTDEGLIVLENDEGQPEFLNATQLGRLLADHRSLRLVILNSCEGARGSKRDIFSSTAATLVRRGIPAVLAMQYEISDKAAIELSRTFYEALSDGMPIDMAVSEARKTVSLAVTNSLEWGTPVLYMRSPDGVLFDLPKKSLAQQKQPNSSTIVSSTTNTQQKGTITQSSKQPPKKVTEPSDVYLRELELYKRALSSLEEFVDTSSNVGLPFLDTIEDSILDIIKSLRNIPSIHQKLIPKKEDILDSLREARIQLRIARSSYENENIEPFYRGLENCRQHIRLALDKW
ncbi:MAG: CHAT domain-containing protein [Ktedonobacteraceae bacterium]